MTRSTLALVFLAGAVAAAAAQVGSDGPQLTATGLFPVHDSSGETHGELFAWHTTPAIYDAFEDANRELVLLNPGGAYSPLDEAGNLEFAREAGVRTAIIPRLMPTKRDGPKDSSPTLQLEVKAVDVQSGATLHAFTLSEDVSRKDLERGFDFGPGLHNRRFLWIPGANVTARHSKSRPVGKQVLGKVINRFAEAVRANVLTFSGPTLVYPSAALHQGVRPATCEADFMVRYIRQKATSKAYAIIVNGREESVGVRDTGVVSLTLESGLNMFEVTLKDGPYRMPVQKEYAINRWIDCSPDERHLTMEVGPVGEALIVARR